MRSHNLYMEMINNLHIIVNVHFIVRSEFPAVVGRALMQKSNGGWKEWGEFFYNLPRSVGCF